MAKNNNFEGKLPAEMLQNMSAYNLCTISIFLFCSSAEIYISADLQKYSENLQNYLKFDSNLCHRHHRKGDNSALNVVCRLCTK